MADPELRKNPAPIAAPMPMSRRCRPLRVREGCVSAGMLRESVVSVIPLLPQFTAIGLSVVSKAVVLLHVRLLLYLGVRSRNGKNRTLRPSKDHSTKRKRSRTRLQLVLRQNGYWKTNCFVMEVEHSSRVHSPSSPRGESSLPYFIFRFVCAPLDGHSEDHAGLTRRGLERASSALARAPRNTCLTNLSLNSSVNGDVRNKRR